ncbi:hypothetical protein [Methylobacterium oryzae]|uniref:hypothetical protein n=1 Tax=Methylobacterium oryzae TaxID=334852 RepID=UPI002F2E08D7
MQNKSVLPVIGEMATIQNVTFTGTSAATTNGFGNEVDYIEFTTDADGYYAIGASPTATTNDRRVWAKERICEVVDPGQKIAFITG